MLLLLCCGLSNGKCFCCVKFIRNDPLISCEKNTSSFTGSLAVTGCRRVPVKVPALTLNGVFDLQSQGCAVS